MISEMIFRARQQKIWFQTNKGIKFHPGYLTPENINISDISHSLSLLCRFNGHCNNFYSVAQHSVMCSFIVNKEHALSALLHDATEAYISDVPTPIKRLIPEIAEFENYLWSDIISKAFGLPKSLPPEVKKADAACLKWEKHYIVNDYGYEWNIQEYYPAWFPKLHKRTLYRVLKYKLRSALSNKIILPDYCLSPKEANKLFKKRYDSLIR